jgi:hypothetical protein
MRVGQVHLENSEGFKKDFLLDMGRAMTKPT